MPTTIWRKSSYCAQGEACLNIASSWKKSPHCAQGESCVHVSLTPQKSSYCQEGEACLHISQAPDTIHLTESADPTETVLATTPAAFSALLSALKRNRP
ncbi:DUF397 domain-containing protein [Streptomyces sp. NPDC059785]|uniref:DUF397 domain-containing protein n=1 Tax=unclassified Streptomyces TaxID=2593676 RepID=UPI00365AFC47